MSDLKYTPGPWLFRGKSESVHARCETHPYGEVIFQFNDECAPSDQYLNLILAAPELLAALERMIGKAYKQNWNDNYPDELAQAEAAIAKARGEA